MTFALLEASLWVWIVILGPILFILGALAVNSKAGESIAFLIVLILATQFFTDVNPWRLFTGHGWEILGWGSAYLVVGALYMVGRWKWLFIPKIRAAYDKFMSEPSNANKPLSDRNRSFSFYAAHLGLRNFPIKVGDYKSQLYCWAFYWPLVIVGEFLDDPLRLIRDWFGRMLQKIADNAFTGA